MTLLIKTLLVYLHACLTITLSDRMQIETESNEAMNMIKDLIERSLL